MARVLLVDDSSANRVVLGALLTDDGLDVVLASSRDDAAKILEGGGVFDVVLLDQHLGDGLGTDLVPVIRGALPTARLVLISGSLDDPLPPGVRFDAVVEKDVAFEMLVPEVRRLLRS